MTNFDTIGKRIKNERISRDWTLSFMSFKTGISTTHLSAIERGESNFTVSCLIQFAEAFGVSSDYLLFGDLNHTESYKNIISCLIEDSSPYELHIFLDVLTVLKDRLSAKLE